MKSNQKGFSAVEGLLILVVVCLIGFIGWYVWRTKSQTDKSLNTAASTSATASTSKNTASPQKIAGTTVSTPDNEASIVLPDGWAVVQKLNGSDSQRYCGFATTSESQGVCLMDI